ncbi:MAG: hypothetical protein KC547_22490 [Anaerolineae bacterium]|nr:hypothetical protein [Anaerolineae bacterium]MCA9909979.1 hypothetical protein [Anaerolineae bacterium]
MQTHNQPANLTIYVREGMHVFDMNGDKIGKVEFVRMSDEDPSTEYPETVTPGAIDEQNSSFIEEIADVFTDWPQLPEEMRERLLRSGFVRIDRGLLKSDAIATPEQIARVSEDGVHLNVTEDNLFAL